MILYTIVPPQQVFYEPAKAEYEYRQVHNSYVQGVRIDGKFSISRLISTDPSMYLDPRYAPGQFYGHTP